MKLQRLTGLEQAKIVEEYQEILKNIAQLEKVLGSEKVLKQVIKKELLEIQKNFQNPRRTVIIDQEIELTIEDLIVE